MDLAIDAARAAFRELGRARAAAWEQLPRLGDALVARDGMDALRAAIAHVWSTGDDGLDAIAAIGAMPVFAAAWSRTRRGLAAIAPSPELDHAADYLGMTIGTPGSAAAARALDAYLVTVIDHGMNASTFTARVVTSTATDLISAVVAAIGALKGPLHGGAPGPVLDMLDAIGLTMANAGGVAARRARRGPPCIMVHGPPDLSRARSRRAAVLEAARSSRSRRRDSSSRVPWRPPRRRSCASASRIVRSPRTSNSLQNGRAARCDRPTARAVLGDVRGRTGLRLVRPRDRAAACRQADPAGVELRRPDASLIPELACVESVAVRIRLRLRLHYAA